MEKGKKGPEGTRWLTKQDVMKYLSASKRAVENYMASGKLRYYRLAGRVYFDINELDEDVRGGDGVTP